MRRKSALEFWHVDLRDRRTLPSHQNLNLANDSSLSLQGSSRRCDDLPLERDSLDLDMRRHYDDRPLTPTYANNSSQRAVVVLETLSPSSS